MLSHSECLKFHFLNQNKFSVVLQCEDMEETQGGQAMCGSGRLKEVVEVFLHSI